MAKKHKDWKNFDDYLKGKAKLENAVLQHPEEGDDGKSVYDYMQKQVQRNLWVIPYDQLKKRDK